MKIILFFPLNLKYSYSAMKTGEYDLDPNNSQTTMPDFSESLREDMLERTVYL